jgi:hypothetical protein
MNPRYPVFIPTKGRWQTLHTIKALTKMGVPFRAVVEPQEFDHYAAAIGAKKLLVLPHSDKGLVVTRNWIWDYARDSGTPRFWTIDDNALAFYRKNRNRIIQVSDGSIFAAAEDFVERYENVPIAGFQYEMFVFRRRNDPPFATNTRVYSNMLIETDARDPLGRPYRNEGFYNDDTDLCLRVLKDGRCTILFNCFLIKKLRTMLVKGGMTPHYLGDGRQKMAEELRRKHPDVTKVVWKWGRWQHQVDYRPFRGNKLIRRADAKIPDQPDNYGMELVRVRKRAK